MGVNVDDGLVSFPYDPSSIDPLFAAMIGEWMNNVMYGAFIEAHPSILPRVPAGGVRLDQPTCWSVTAGTGRETLLACQRLPRLCSARYPSGLTLQGRVCGLRAARFQA
jgi:hypothetical protein